MALLVMIAPNGTYGRLPYQRLLLAALAVVAIGLAESGRAQDLALLQQPRNSAFAMPVGQGLSFVHSAEPLGKSRFRMRAINRTQRITVPQLGDGSTYTGLYGLGYGFSNSIDVGLTVPFFLDSVAGLSKYGTSDPVVAVKWATPTKIPAGLYRAFQLSIGLPLGYKGETGIDKVGGVRPFSNEAVDIGLQFLMDFHFSFASLFLNGGLFRSGNVDVPTQLAYGVGIEHGRRNRWVSFNAEYETRVVTAEQSRAASVFKVGTRLKLFRGVELEVNREIGFQDYPSNSATTLGIRTHGYLTGRRRLESRTALYQPVPKPKRIYEPDKVLRIAILDFEGFEDYRAGERLTDRIKTLLAPHDSLEIVDPKKYSGVRSTGMLSPPEAIDLGRKLDVDVVISGEISRYDTDRFAGLKVPFVFEIPETAVSLSMRYRVMWFTSPTKTEMEAFTQEVSADGRMRKRIRVLPADRPDITVRRSALEIAEVHEKALDKLVGNLLASMATQFSWIPPDFAYD